MELESSAKIVPHKCRQPEKNDIYWHIFYLNVSISIKIIYEIVFMTFVSK